MAYNGTQGLYQSGRRFALSGWTAEEWARLFSGVEQSAAQFYGTVNRTPVAALPATTVSTPLGAVPSWLIPAGLLGALVWAASRPRRNPPRRGRSRARRRRR